jgi:catechol 2,3-dioxygenase-like lactoylglutathione lyase family enzyme
MAFSIKPRGVVHFSLSVSDLEVSKKFYTEMLGLTFVRHSTAYEMMFLTAGQDFVTLCKSETPIQPNPKGRRRVHHAFALAPDTYEDAKKFLWENGVEIIDGDNSWATILYSRSRPKCHRTQRLERKRILVLGVGSKIPLATHRQIGER